MSCSWAVQLSPFEVLRSGKVFERLSRPCWTSTRAMWMASCRCGIIVRMKSRSMLQLGAIWRRKPQGPEQSGLRPRLDSLVVHPRSFSYFATRSERNDMSAKCGQRHAVTVRYKEKLTTALQSHYVTAKQSKRILRLF